MIKANISTDDPRLCRALADDPRFTSAELFQAAADGHSFRPGQTCILAGLESYPEFNGQQVKITSIREDGPRGRAYYVEGSINRFVNWVYEYRLQPLPGE